MCEMSVMRACPEDRGRETQRHLCLVCALAVVVVTEAREEDEGVDGLVFAVAVAAVAADIVLFFREKGDVPQKRLGEWMIGYAHDRDDFRKCPPASPCFCVS